MAGREVCNARRFRLDPHKRSIMESSAGLNVNPTNTPERLLSLVSNIIPFLNEQDGLSVLFERLEKALDPTIANKELIVADDGSTDGTRASLPKALARFPCWKLIGLSRNFDNSPPTGQVWATRLARRWFSSRCTARSARAVTTRAPAFCSIHSVKFRINEFPEASNFRYWMALIRGFRASHS